MKRVAPGSVPPSFWALVPEQVGEGEWAANPRSLPSLLSERPNAIAFLSLSGEDLAFFGPYGDASATPHLVQEATRAAQETGRQGIVAVVRNDETDRWDALQRLGFTVREARLGVLTQQAGAQGGGIAARDLFLLWKAAASTGGREGG